MKRKTLAYIVMYSILPIVDMTASMLNGDPWYIGFLCGVVMDIVATALFFLVLWILLSILD